MSPGLKSTALFQLSSVALFWSPAAGSLVALAAIALHLLLVRRERGELMAVGAFALGGGVCETLLMHAGLVRFTTPGTVAALCPLWVIVFWAALGTLVNGPLSALRERRLLAFLAGLVAAPASFALSEALGALTLSRPLPDTLAAIAALMALALPAMFETSRRIV